MVIFSLTIDDSNEFIKTMVFGTEAEVYERLRQEYEEFAELADADLVTELTEHQGIVLYIDEHVVHVPVDNTVYRIDFSPAAIDEHFEMDGEDEREPNSAGAHWLAMTAEQRTEASEAALASFEGDGLWDSFHDAICDGIRSVVRERLSS